jgi:nucleotide-binding universal stress UspA family protein
MKKILVPTDFSPCADNAVAVGLEIARKANSEIVFHHLFDDKSGSLHTLKPEAAQKERARQDAELGHAKASLDALVHQAGQIGLSAKPLLVMNKGTDKIENYIEPLQIGLVVMGSHGASGIRELIIGSQTQRVVRHATAPVLVIKHKPDRISFEDILFASTFQEDPRPILDKLIQFASLWGGIIHLLYIGLEKDKQTKAEVEEKMNTLARQFPNAKLTKNFITTNDPEWGISHASKDIKPDAIAITTHLKVGVFGFTHSLAENLVNHEETPVFAINTR